jgi:hypothetical protein
MAFFYLRIALTLFAVLGGAEERPGNFKIIGLGGGGAMFHPTISPHDPNTVLLNCDMANAVFSAVWKKGFNLIYRWKVE